MGIDALQETFGQQALGGVVRVDIRLGVSGVSHAIALGQCVEDMALFWSERFYVLCVELDLIAQRPAGGKRAHDGGDDAYLRGVAEDEAALLELFRDCRVGVFHHVDLAAALCDVLQGSELLGVACRQGIRDVHRKCQARGQRVEVLRRGGENIAAVAQQGA